MTTCLIGLGGNLGNVPQTIVQALQLLSQSPGVRVERWSSLYQTAPVGAAAGTEFTNAAAQLETTLSARELLSSLLAVEDELGRERSIEWGPRTLDLDLLFFGDNVIDDPPVLHVPHSGCWYRRFVLDPLFELVPDFVHPEKQQTIAELRARLLARPFRVDVLDLAGSVDPALRAMQAMLPESELRAIRQPDEVREDDHGLLVRLDSGPLPPWALPLKSRVGWLDVSARLGDRQQKLINILRSVGL
ncbi:MAG: 2-amino-4-hydroxy-6-hydroxymethyldihydropteridine diphosphokinase [Planctomycetes bacterium]|nr:2-amino-4-hydroxy-6-hydroxymethyldihydropteridine diphosphokinase [Planctomycetota bacterium]